MNHKIGKVLQHFEVADEIMHGQLTKMKLRPLSSLTDSSQYFGKLCHTIIGQQLAGKAADAICCRFDLLFPDGVNPERVLSFSDTELRAVGLSWAKVRSVLDLAQKIHDGEVILEGIDQLDNEAVVSELIKVKGIGRWTAEMFLIFTLAREDVFSFGDLGLKKGFLKLYGSTNNMAAITARWSPYRSYASLALWNSLDF